MRYDPLRPLAGLRRALHTFKPVAVLPADETLARQLGELWQRDHARDDSGMLETLLTRSLGGPAQLRDAGSRMALQRAAEAEGILTPSTMEIRGPGDLARAFEWLGAPLMLKADASSGGRGVQSVDSRGAAERLYRKFSRAPHLPRALLRGVLYNDWTYLRSSLRRERRGVCAQRIIAGAERTAMVVAQGGKVLASESFEVVHTWKLRGPSSVVRRVQDPRMDAAIQALVRRLAITGFCGFDFIVDTATGAPLLLERNARPTQVAHLSFGPGHDLAAAYVRSVLGREVKDRVSATDRDLIALFPQELQRDKQSALLCEAYHDVPWESPELIERVLRANPGLRSALEEGRTGASRTDSSVSLRLTQ